MAAYPISKPQYGIYNPNNFSKQTSSGDALTVDTGKLYFLQFPNAQTSQTEFLHSIGVSSDATFEGPVIFNDSVVYNQDIEFNSDVIVDGTATIGGNLLCDTTATISDLLTCETGIDISVSGGITFPDNTTQTTAFIEANYAQLNTDNTFLSPFIQTFEGIDTGINGTNAPLRFSNSVTDEYGSLFVDPSTSTDLTVYSNQSLGGLTVRNINGYSYTCNPIAGNIANFKNPISSDFGLTGQSLTINTTGDDTYIIDSKSSDGFGLTIVNQSGNAKLSLSNGSTNVSSITCTSGNLLDFGASSLTTTGAINITTSSYFSSGINTGINNNQLIRNNVYPFIYFALYDTNDAQFIPLYIYVNALRLAVNINMDNNTITNVQSIGGNGGGALTVTTPINMSSGQSLSINNESLYIYSGTEFSSFNQNSTLNQLTIYNNAPQTDNSSNISFNINNLTGLINQPVNIFRISLNTVDIKTTLNMNSQNIINAALSTGCTGVTQSIGTSNTTLATTQFVIQNQGTPDLTNYAQLTTTNPQTFTGPVTLSGSTNTTTQSTGNNTTLLATTAFVNSSIAAIGPVYTASSFVLTSYAGSMVMNPSTVNTITTYTSANNIVSFNSSLFTLTTLTSGFFIVMNFTFSNIPFPTYPPAVLQDTMSMFCVTNNTTYVTQVVFSSFTPGSISIYYPPTAPSGPNTIFNLDLSTIGAFSG